MVARDIAERHALGQPVLVGTTSVEKSEYLSKLLAKQGIRHEVLNAKNHAREAAIVAQAGRFGAVTVATNMAGRGTDIMLGGNAEFLAVSELAATGLNPAETPEEYEAAWTPTFERVKQQVGAEAARVTAVGGLYVLGTERHESRRIDNQLRGRAGRQGDPGESRFYLSLTDDLMRLFNSGAAEAIMSRSNIPDDTAIESALVSRAIRSAQSQVEARNAEIRKNVLKYDDVLNRQREAIYADRAHILEGDDLRDRIQIFLTDVINDVINEHAGVGNGDDWDFDALWTELKTIFPISITIDEVIAEAGAKGRVNRDFVAREVLSDARIAYERREQMVGEAAMRELERRVVLSVVDRRWRDHLYEMDYLKDGIGLRAMAQRDPLIEYQREGFALYSGMMQSIKSESVGFLFNLEVEVQQAPGDPAHPSVAAKGLARDEATSNLSYSAPSADGGVEVRNQRGEVEAAATRAAQRQQERAAAAATGQPAPAQAAPAAGRGAFGQPTSAGDAPINRAQRRAQEKRR
jgi:preprotein translocase subunit SecA